MDGGMHFALWVLSLQQLWGTDKFPQVMGYCVPGNEQVFVGRELYRPREEMCSSSDEALPRGPGKEVKRKQPQQQKRCEEPPSLEGDEPPDPLAWCTGFCALHRWRLPGGFDLGCGGGERVGGRTRRPLALGCRAARTSQD